MPRPIREDYPGAWHHVMHRGRRRESTFRDDDDRYRFLDTIGEAVGLFGIEVHAYSLMPNHYHLLIRTPFGNLSRGMRHLNGTFTQRFNARHRTDGALFRGRFRSQVVREERYLLHLLAYIHLNPVRAGLITKVDGVLGWTSHRAYMGKEQKPRWLTTSLLSAQFESAAALQRAVVDLARGRAEWPDGMKLKTGWLDWSRVPIEITSEQAGVGSPSVTLEELVRAICKVTGAGPRRLKRGVRGRIGNPARRFGVWALRHSTTLTQREIGAALGMSAAHVAKELERWPERGAELENWVAEWERRFPDKMSIVKV